MNGGLTSITFRKCTPAEIVDMAVEAKLRGIEWGGDVHVPHGNTARAAEVKKLTEDAGLAVASYGSYYRLTEEKEISFKRVAETAVALGAPIVRVWAGRTESADADAGHWLRVEEEARRIADIASEADLLVSFEFHSGSLNDAGKSSRKLMAEIGRPAFRTHWQTRIEASAAERMADLKAVLPWLSHIHAFHWAGSFHRRLPLEDGREEWLAYLRTAVASGWDGYVLIEYVKKDSPQQLAEDARALNSWIDEVNARKGSSEDA